MKVLLLKDIAKVGRIHDVKDVADGYALNNLIPRGLAVLATEQVLRTHEAAQKEKKAAAHEGALRAKSAFQNLQTEELSLMVKADSAGHLYKKVGTKEVAEALTKRAGILITEDAVQWETLRTAGSGVATVRVHGATYRVVVHVRAV